MKSSLSTNWSSNEIMLHTSKSNSLKLWSGQKTVLILGGMLKQQEIAKVMVMIKKKTHCRLVQILDIKYKQKTFTVKGRQINN